MDNKKLLAIAAVVIIVVAAIGVYVVASGSDDDDKVVSSGMATRLNICGNANLDNYLNEDDIELMEKIIAKEAEETELADANHDGTVDQADIDLVRDIMAFKSDEVWYLDLNGNYVKISGSIDSVAIQYWPTLQAFVAIGAESLIKYSDSGTLGSITAGRYGQSLVNAGITSFGSGFHSDYDFETIMAMDVDAIACGSADIYFIDLEEKFTSSTAINMIRLPFWEEDCVASAYITLAYILGNEQYVQNAYEYLDYTEEIKGLIDDRLSDLNEKKSVLVCYYSTGSDNLLEVEIECRGSGSYECSVIAGLDNLSSTINKDGVLASDTMYYSTDIEYIYKLQPDYIIMLHSSGTNYTQANQQEAYEKWSTYLTKTDAYKNGNMLVSGSGITSGLYQTALSLLIACEVYPDQFEGVDAYSYLQYIVDNFTLMNSGVGPSDDAYFDVTKDGAYLYRGTN